MSTTIVGSDFSEEITRVEVIDENGRAYVNWEVEDLQLHVQDSGRTLKLFVRKIT